MSILSGLGNVIADQNPETQPQHMDKHALAVVLTAVLVGIAGVQTMILEMFAEHMEEIRKLIREDRKEPTTLVIEPF